ncbi:hypothetical protein CPZ30_12005 [Paenibacillus lautus]|nr:hypothetical protein CPZ30_12005 [Paenibacillus lautus]
MNTTIIAAFAIPTQHDPRLNELSCRKRTSMSPNPKPVIAGLGFLTFQDGITIVGFPLHNGSAQPGSRFYFPDAANIYGSVYKMSYNELRKSSYLMLRIHTEEECRHD